MHGIARDQTFANEGTRKWVGSLTARGTSHKINLKLAAASP